ncbi:LOW QUALITY PROTEIN: SCO-spondin-like [Megaptera novaeangliae]
MGHEHLRLSLQWCKRTETILVEEEVTPRQEDLVPCTSLHHYQRRGWRLDLTWSGRARPCPIYKPLETRPAAWNRTVRACCPGWGGGTHCILALAEASLEGHCFATWLCQPRAGSANASVGSLEACCAWSWGHSWRDGCSQPCHSWSSHKLPGGSTDPSLRERHSPGRHLLPRGAVRIFFKLVPPAEYHEACPFAYCAAAPAGSGREERLEAACPTLASYAQDCARRIHVRWRKPGFCERLCLGGRLCSDCASACPPSCSAVGEGGEGSCGEGCVSGCERPPGLFWDGALCVPAARWPCYHRRRRYDTGDTVRRLRSPRWVRGPRWPFRWGWRLPGPLSRSLPLHPLHSTPHPRPPPPPWGRSGARPPVPRAHSVGQDGRWLCAQAPCPAEGVLGGDGHYLTFDGRSFSFRGRAGRRFSLVQDFVKRQLLTVLEHGDCNAGSCLHATSVSLGGTHVQLRDSGSRSSQGTYLPGLLLPAALWSVARAPGASCHLSSPCGLGLCPAPSIHTALWFLSPALPPASLNQNHSPSCNVPSPYRHQSSPALWGLPPHRPPIAGAVLVDGQDVVLPWRSTGGLSVSRASPTFLLLRWPGALVLWGASDPAAYITLDPRHALQVCRRAGEWLGEATRAWNQQDDFLTPAGDVETSIAAFASKFQVAGEGRCPSEDSAPLSRCSTHTQRHIFAGAACAILHGPVFQECHGLVGREPFHLRCLTAACGCAPGGDCLCPVLAAYARRCAQEGALLSWRDQTFCPVLRPGGQEYQECAPVCGRNCGETEGCGELGSCVAGCNCPLGLLWAEGQCVPPGSCPCQLGAHRYAPGSATMKDCNRCICQERSLWNCTAQRCAPPWAFCPHGLIYVPGACLLTCDSPSANGSCPPGSMGGCVCPPGTVLLDEGCIPPELCPCCHGGQWYPPNAAIQEDYSIWVCQGRQWRCTGQRCDGRCQASGAPHYVIFDRLALTFPGACEYLLVEASGRFTISAQDLPCGASGLTCTKALTMRLQSTVVHMLRGQAVTVNGVSVTPPKVYTGSGLSLRRAGLFLLLTTCLGLTLLWDGGTGVLVQLSPEFRGRVAGLCGDFDGDASNDLRNRQGVCLEPTAELVAHSWCLNPLCPEPGDLPPPCAVNAHRAGWARACCGVMLQPLFARCHAEVPPEQHCEWCVHVTRGCDSGGDCECLCSAIATYADECSRPGTHMRWRSQELCPLQCEGGQGYEACGPCAPPTCHDHGDSAAPRVGSEWAEGRGPQGHGDRAGTEGCCAPFARALPSVISGVCLEPAPCPCEWRGSFFPPGTVLQRDCGNCTCQESQWLCGDDGSRGEGPVPGGAEGEAPCQESGHCVPHGWLCDYQDDRGDGSDEEGCATPGLGEGQMSCSSGHCLPLALICDGQDDCGGGTDEQGCLCPQDSLACADGRCLPPALLCDGHPDFPDAADEESCQGQVNCTPGEVSCVDGACVGTIHLCDGICDCPDGANEGPGHCPLPSLPTPPAGTLPGPSAVSRETAPTPQASVSPQVQGPPLNRLASNGNSWRRRESFWKTSRAAKSGSGWTWGGPGAGRGPEGPGGGAEPEAVEGPGGLQASPGAPPGWSAEAPAAPPCGPVDFASGGSGEGAPRGWRCDGEEDCADGGDETGCDRPCAPHLPPCARGPLRRCATARTGTLAPAVRARPARPRAQRAGRPLLPPPPDGPPPPALRGGAPSPYQAWRSPLCPRKSDLHGRATWWRLGAVHRPHLLPCGLPLLDPSQRLLPPCGSLFPCGLAPQLCLNPERLCDGLPDCPQGEDELGCGWGAGGAPKAEVALTPFPPQVCDGQPDCELAGEAGPSREEQRCEAWGPWSPWAPCSQTRGPGVRGCSRRCSPPSLPVLRHCPGPEPQTQACFTATCPGEGSWAPGGQWGGRGLQRAGEEGTGPRPNLTAPLPTGRPFLLTVDSEWTSWSPWSPCSEPCRGTRTRQRQCLPPRNRGQTCAMLPGDPPSTRQTRPCPQDGCPNVTCSRELVFHPCAPCPLTCDDLSGQAECPPDRPCSSPGCWRPTGQVLGDEGQCVWPRQCPCLVDGTRYWRGQRIEANCRLCICQDGRPRRCRPNPDCAVNCGWPSWSPWAECLGPCGGRSIQWSFQSANSARLAGRGRQRQGIHRKARSYCTRQGPAGTLTSPPAPTWEAVCAQARRVRRVGDRRREGPCGVCECLHDSTSRCSPCCPLGSCPQDWVLVEGVGESCCHCVLPGENHTVRHMAPPAPSPQIGAPLITHVLPPPGDPCYFPLGLARLPEGSLHASPQQLERPTWAAILRPPTGAPGQQGWSPVEDAYAQWHTQPPYLQLDLLRPRNLSGIMVQGAGSSDLLQFSNGGLHWHNYCDVLPGIQPPPKLFPGNRDDVAPAVWTFGRMVQARYIQVWPLDVYLSAAPHGEANHGIPLPAELLGCEPVPPCSGVGHRCASGECALRGAPCAGVEGCEAGSDEEGCLPPPAGTGRWVPSEGPSRCGVLGVCAPVLESGAGPRPSPPPSLGSPPKPREGLAEAGAERWRPQQGSPVPPTGKGPVSLASTSHPSLGETVQTETTTPTSQPEAKALRPEMAAVTVLPPHPMTPVAPAVAGAWAVWDAWGPCSVSGGGGHRSRWRSCVDPPPEDGGCGLGRVRASAELCQMGLVPPCPPSCLNPEANRSCGRHCLEGEAGPASRGAVGRALGGVTLAACWAKQPGVPFLLDDCSRCVCGKEALLCEPGGCPVACGWSAWSSWGPCDRSCGSGVRARFRSPSRPPAASGGSCEEALGWTPWGPRSACSRSSLVPAGGPGWRSRSWLCPNPGDTSCPGEATQEEPCSPAVCPAQCPGDMVFCSAEQCHQEGGSRPRLCLAQGPGVECTSVCTPGCACPPALFLHGASCLPVSQCPCQLRGQLYAPGAVARLDSCNNCTCISGVMLCTSEPCPVACGWSPWTLSHSHSCNVGVRRRFRAGTAPPAAFGGTACQGPNIEAELCSPAAMWISCDSGLITNCTSWSCEEGQPTWSPWTPWSECSASCGPARRHRHRFSWHCCPHCLQHHPSAQALRQRRSPASCWGVTMSPVEPRCGLCALWMPSALRQPSPRHSCVGGLRSRTPPRGLGDYCEGPPAQGAACQALPCPVTNCTAIQGAEYSPCGPPCPRSCDDLVPCVWHCQPGGYCPPGQVLSADGAVCVQPSRCSCLDQLTGERHRPGAQLARPDGCNYCACSEGRLTYDLPCPVPGVWCPWWERTACSQPCRGQTRTRSRACTCPAPQLGGVPCPGEAGEAGAQHQRETCASPPMDGAWDPWGPWSPCDVCLGQSHRSRACSWPPTSEGGRPCPGGHRQSRPCQDNSTQCTDCAGGGLLPCGRPCPRSCQDLSPGVVCQPGSTGCQPSCGCPPGQLSQHGLCVSPAQCRCQYQPGAMGANLGLRDGNGQLLHPWAGPGIPENQSRSAGSGLSSWESLEPGEVATGPRDNCTCVAGILQYWEVPDCPGVRGSWGPWEDGSVSCGGGEQLCSWRCARPPCPRPAHQSRICRTRVCRAPVHMGSCPAPWVTAPRLGLASVPRAHWVPACSCGGLGTRTCNCHCARPTPTPRGQDCRGPGQDLEYCLSPDCPGAAGSMVEPVTGLPGGWGLWSPWSPCSSSCTDPTHPAWGSRTRLCLANCRGASSQERPCNLPSCTAVGDPCQLQQILTRVCTKYSPKGPIQIPRLPWESATTVPPERGTGPSCQSRTTRTPWGAWSRCQVPCSGGFRLRWRGRGPPGGGCRGPWAQTESCNMGPCPGESCEARDTVPTPDCADHCPRSCADLWDRVQCLQGRCHPGCRCPPGQLVQDGRRVPMSSCRCGLPSPSASWVLAPAEGAWLDCRAGVAARRRPGRDAGSSGWEARAGSGLWALLGSRGSAHPDSQGSEPFLHTAATAPVLTGPWCAAPTSVQPSGLGQPGAAALLPVGAPPRDVAAARKVLGGHRARSRTRRSCRNVTCSPAPVGTQGAGCLLFPAVLPSPGPVPADRQGRRPVPRQPPPWDTTSLSALLAERPPGQVLSPCSTSCPRLCSHLQPGTLCMQEPCQLGCDCPGGQLLHNGVCAPPAQCPCTQLSLPWGLSLTPEEQGQELPPGTLPTQNCTRCVCQDGAFSCPLADCRREMWAAQVPAGPPKAKARLALIRGEGPACPRRCYLHLPSWAPLVFGRVDKSREVYSETQKSGGCWSRVGSAGDRRRDPRVPSVGGGRIEAGPRADLSGGLSGLPWQSDPPEKCGSRWPPGSWGPVSRRAGSPTPRRLRATAVRGRPGCVCRRGHFRSQEGPCVPADHCKCWHHGRPHPPGSEWQEACESCRCISRRSACTQHCPLLTCAQGEVAVQEPGSCCPTCRQETLEEQPSCWYLTELHNLTKGPCYLDQVEVSYCGGHCPSSTNVLPEVSREGGCRPRGVRSSGGPQWPVAVSLEPSQGPEDTRDKVHLTGIQLIRARGEFSPRWWHTCHLAR